MWYMATYLYMDTYFIVYHAFDRANYEQGSVAEPIRVASSCVIDDIAGYRAQLCWWTILYNAFYDALERSF